MKCYIPIKYKKLITINTQASFIFPRSKNLLRNGT